MQVHSSIVIKYLALCVYRVLYHIEEKLVIAVRKHKKIYSSLA